jgi:hypothetical protein
VEVILSREADDFQVYVSFSEDVIVSKLAGYGSIGRKEFEEVIS